MSASSISYDLIIVGAGPSGSAAALYARRYGLKTLLLDKATFPRDKVCGDALSGKSVAILRDLGLLEKTAQLPGAAIQRIIFTSPNHTELEIDLTNSHLDQIPEGFVIRRKIFDQFLFEQARQAADTCLEGFTVTGMVLEDGRVCGVRGKAAGSDTEVAYRGRIILGADGYNSMVARRMGLYRHEPKHLVVALRQYYENVTGLTNQIELHFVDEVLPGYFWIFPLENGYANVGIGIHYSDGIEKHIEWAKEGVNFIFHSSDISLARETLIADFQRFRDAPHADHERGRAQRDAFLLRQLRHARVRCA